MTKAQQFEQLYRQLEEATPLPLAEQPSDIIPGEGNPDSRIFLIGEAPGEREAALRRPFVGRSGQLLRSTLTEVGLPPATVWITNIVKARPPQNRDPSPTEIEAYRPWVNQEIEITQPEIIVTLGRFSMGKFLPDVKISQVHGRLDKVTFNGDQVFVLPMYHPAAALRGTKMKQAFLADFSKLPKILTWIDQQDEQQQLEQDVVDHLI